MNLGDFFIFSTFSLLLQKQIYVHGFEPLTSCMSSNFYSTSPIVSYLNDVSFELNSDSTNFRNKLRCFFVKNSAKFALNFCKNSVKCPEEFFSKHSPNSPHFLHQFATKYV